MVSKIIIIIRYSSVSLSLILGRNEKVEQHTRKKTYKSNALRFWVKVVSFPYMLAQFSFLGRSPWCLSPRILRTSGIKADGL